MIRKIEAETSSIANEMAVHLFVETSFLPHHLPVTGSACRIAPQRAMEAHRWTPFKVPAPALKSSRFIRVNACGAEIDEIPGKGALQPSTLEPAEVGTVPDLQGPQVTITRKILIETPASPTVDAPVHFMLDKRTQVLIHIGALFPLVTPDPVACGDGFILKEAVTPFVTDGAVVGMI